jgi:hypothetical protein
MMLHAAIHWPEEADLTLWPFALDYAVHLYNRMPGRQSGIAPVEVFCGTSLDCRILRNAHVWGCPAYVLDPTLQDGRRFQSGVLGHDVANSLVSRRLTPVRLALFGTCALVMSLRNSTSSMMTITRSFRPTVPTKSTLLKCGPSFSAPLLRNTFQTGTNLTLNLLPSTPNG